MISYDPSKAPVPTIELIEESKRLNMNIINVMCDTADLNGGEIPGVGKGMSFLALVHFVPRIGEEIEFTDGRLFTVKWVHHKTTIMQGSASINPYRLMANVVAFPYKKPVV